MTPTPKELLTALRLVAPNDPWHGFDVHDFIRRVRTRTTIRVPHVRVVQTALDRLREMRVLDSRKERTHPGGPRRPVYWKPESQGGRA